MEGETSNIKNILSRKMHNHHIFKFKMERSKCEHYRGKNKTILKDYMGYVKQASIKL